MPKCLLHVDVHVGVGCTCTCISLNTQPKYILCLKCNFVEESLSIICCKHCIYSIIHSLKHMQGWNRTNHL